MCRSDVDYVFLVLNIRLRYTLRYLYVREKYNQTWGESGYLFFYALFVVIPIYMCGFVIGKAQ